MLLREGIWIRQRFASQFFYLPPQAPFDLHHVDAMQIPPMAFSVTAGGLEILTTSPVALHALGRKNRDLQEAVSSDWGGIDPDPGSLNTTLTH